MLNLTEDQAAMIQAAFDSGGELSAAIELRRLYPLVRDNARARQCVRIIVGWESLPAVRSPLRAPGAS